MAIFIIYTALFNANAQTPFNDPNWILIPTWHDEFNGLEINSTYWTVKNYFDHYLYSVDISDCSFTKGDEGQLYRNRKRSYQGQNERETSIYNYDIENGTLKLLLQNDNCDCPPNMRTPWGCSMQYYFDHCGDNIPLYHFSSAAIELKDDFRFKYGYIEARVKMNCGNGFFPAFWLFGIDDSSLHQGSNYQEIDVFEMQYGHYEDNLGIVHDQNIMTSNRHYTLEQIHKSTLYTIYDYTNYHNYGLEWTPSKIIFYVDGYIYRIEKNDGIFDSKKIIFNFAIHENEANNLGDYFPGIMDIDYVRIYKPRTDYSTILNMNNYDFSSHDNKVKKKIIMTGNNALQTTDNVYLRATDGVEINGDFIVPLGAELYIDVNEAY
jgi:hypothetical protein